MDQVRTLDGVKCGRIIMNQASVGIFHFGIFLMIKDVEEVEENAASYSVDSYRLVRRKRKQGSKQNGGGGRSGREFCRCKRGPVGYPGAPGNFRYY